MTSQFQEFKSINSASRKANHARRLTALRDIPTVVLWKDLMLNKITLASFASLSFALEVFAAATLTTSPAVNGNLVMG